MKAREIPFTRLKAKARGYLEELATMIKEGQEKPLETTIKDEIGLAQFQIEVGLAVPSLKPEEAAIIDGMCRQVDRAQHQLAVIRFQQKYGS